MNAQQGLAMNVFVDKKTVACWLGKSVRTIERWMQEGTLPYYKVGKKGVLFKRTEVEGLITRQTPHARAG